MTRREKLVERIRHRPPEASFADVRALLELYGWEHDRTRGSHASFVKPGERSQTVPVHNGKVKKRYLDQICNLLDLDVNEETN